VKLAALEKLLRDRIGLDVASIGAAMLPRVVTARMAALGQASPEAYTAYAASNANEWTALAGELAVPETWFYRGGVEFFEYLARWVRTRLTDSFGGRTLRMLCVPCSTGEEPYSLALALDREGVPAARCTIDGVDLTRDHLLRAAAARYTAFSFRERTADPRHNYFRQVEDGRWELRPEFRERVRFRPGNLVDPGFLAGEPPYDLIVCRNLFIYLTADGTARAMANLERLLAPDGLLCLTAAEADRVPIARFVTEGPPSLAMFKKPTADVPAVIRSAAMKPVQPKPAPRFKVAPVIEQTVLDDTAVALALRDSRLKSSDSLHEGRRLADAGNLEAARILCEAAPPSATRFSLLGVIHLAAGRTDEAADAFRKALYLNPDDPEALTHMIVLCEQRGDPGQAAGLRRRLSRLEKGATS